MSMHAFKVRIAQHKIEEQVLVFGGGE